MTMEAWLTAAVVLLCIGLLATNRHPPDVVMLAGLTLLLLTGVITPAEALGGLANEGMVTVAVLYEVASGLEDTGATGWFSQRLLGRRLLPKRRSMLSQLADTRQYTLKMLVEPDSLLVSRLDNSTPPRHERAALYEIEWVQRPQGGGKRRARRPCQTAHARGEQRPLLPNKKGLACCAALYYD